MRDSREIDGPGPRPSATPVPGGGGSQTSTATLVQTGSTVLTAMPGKRAARAVVASAGAQADAATYVGRRVADRPVDAPSTTLEADALDTGQISAVLAALEPADQTTSFADEATESMPLLRLGPIAVPAVAPAPARAGRRRAVRHAGRRGPLLRGLPSAPLLLGLTALAASAGGAVTMGGAELADAAPGSYAQAANALTGTSGVGSVTAARGTQPTSRDVSRAPAPGAGAAAELVEQAAQQRSASLGNFAAQAEQRDAFIAKNQWQVPLASYRLTARYGEYGLWSSSHTGLDFAAPNGTPIKAIANGVVTSAGWDGPYGNKTVVTLDDGTELWFCHQSAFAVQTGDTVRSGDLIGYVGATGNVTGPHVHIEVRPGGGDPIDPYAAFVEHGVTP